LAEAEAAFRELIAIQRAHEPADSEWLNRSRGQLADTLRLMGRHDEALAQIRGAVGALPEAAGSASPPRIHLPTVLAEAELAGGDVAAAEIAADAALRAAHATFPQGGFRLGAPLFVRARVWLARGHADEAEPLLRQSLDVRRPPHPDDDPRVLEVEAALVVALDAQDKHADARRLRAAIQPVLTRSPSPYAAELLRRMHVR